MCGIAGMVNFSGEPVSPGLIRRMIGTLAHRGPDGEEVFTDGAVGLGHRRLAIIDLSDAARQPMATRDGRFVISYNGEVYNFGALRAELESAGIQFRSRSDTEVVIEAIAHWGIVAVRRFNGMFAFALWDRQRRELVLARDRYGVKPLYYVQCGQSILFGSEIKALLAHAGLPMRMNVEALLEYMTFQNFFSDRTLFGDVKLLPAATVMTISADTREMRFDRYWDFCFEEPERSGTFADRAEEFDWLFQQAVKRQLVSDVPVSSYLSGGIDSGSITAIAARQISDLRTFTVGFDLHSASGLELATDEREAAEHMSYLFKTEHYEMVLKAGDMERVLPRLTWHLEEPRVGQSYPNFYASQLAGRFGRVVLAGTGGDELFGGYPWRYYRAAEDDDFERYADRYYTYWQRLISDAETRNLFAPVWNDVSHMRTRDIFRDVLTRHGRQPKRREDYINLSLYLEAKTFLHGLLVVDDKLSMAHGLETRVPFLDNDLVDFAMRLPVSMKLRNLGEVPVLNENEPGLKARDYFDRTHDGKLLVRHVMQRYVPVEAAQRRKQGFSAPDASWFRGESIDYVRSMLSGRNALIFDYFDADTVHALLADHLEGRQNRRLLVWSLIYLEQWCRTFASGRAAAPVVAQNTLAG